MKRIIAIGTSNSRSSINKAFAEWVANHVEDAEIEVLDLNDFELPIYNPDLEKTSGVPINAQKLKEKLNSADGFVVSLAEYNGNYTPVFKNTQDWLSRIARNIWGDKPTMLLAAAPGKMGGQSVLDYAKESFPRMGAKVSGVFSMPTFYEKFNNAEGIVDELLFEAFQIQLNIFKQNFSKN